RIFPFLVRLELPRAVIDFERIIPATDMILIASPNAVLVRRDIHPALIDLLAQTIVEAMASRGFFKKPVNSLRRSIRNIPSLKALAISTGTVLRSCTGICRSG